MDKYYSAFERRIYSIGDLLGQAGGLYGTSLIIGAFFVSAVANRLFVSSILNKIYMLDSGREKDIQADKVRNFDPLKKKSQLAWAKSSVKEK